MPYNPATAFLGIYSREMKMYVHQKNLYTNVYAYGSFICNSSKQETTQLSFKRWEIKQTVVYLHQGILVSNIKKQTIDTQKNLNQSAGNMMSIQKPIPKSSTHYDSMYIFLKQQNFRKEK